MNGVRPPHALRTFSRQIPAGRASHRAQDRMLDRQRLVGLDVRCVLAGLGTTRGVRWGRHCNLSVGRRVEQDDRYSDLPRRTKAPCFVVLPNAALEALTASPSADVRAPPQTGDPAIP